MEEKERDIEDLKKEKDELETKNAEAITKMKKETDLLIMEKAHIFYSQIQVEEAVANSCKHIYENTIE